MNTQQIKQIENCFNPHHVCDMSNLSRPTVGETKDFLELLAEYKQESHVLLHAFLHNSGHFDTEIPF